MPRLCVRCVDGIKTALCESVIVENMIKVSLWFGTTGKYSTIVGTRDDFPVVRFAVEDARVCPL